MQGLIQDVIAAQMRADPLQPTLHSNKTWGKASKQTTSLKKSFSYPVFADGV
jgi:hypothetical protein